MPLFLKKKGGGVKSLQNLIFGKYQNLKLTINRTNPPSIRPWKIFWSENTLNISVSILFTKSKKDTEFNKIPSPVGCQVKI